MSLKQKQAAQKAKKAATINVPETKVLIDSLPREVAEALAQTTYNNAQIMNAVIEQQKVLIKSLQQTVQNMLDKHSQQISAAVKQPIEVTSGDVEVNMPRRATSFTCEFDDGRTATLTPNYEPTH